MGIVTTAAEFTIKVRKLLETHYGHIDPTCPSDETMVESFESGHTAFDFLKWFAAKHRMTPFLSLAGLYGVEEIDE